MGCTAIPTWKSTSNSPEWKTLGLKVSPGRTGGFGDKGRLDVEQQPQNAGAVLFICVPLIYQSECLGRRWTSALGRVALPPA